MAETQTDLAALTARLDRLARSNRRWRGSALAALSAVVVIAALGAAPQKTVPIPEGATDSQGVPFVLRAHSFVLVDNEGKVRAELNIGSGRLPSPPCTVLPLGTRDWQKQPTLTLIGEGGSSSATLSSGFLAFESGGYDETDLGVGGMSVGMGGGGGLLASPYSLTIRDQRGYQTDIGATLTERNGSTTPTSAASIIPWGRPAKNGKQTAIWRVPGPPVP